MNPRRPRARLAAWLRCLLPVAALACALGPGRAALIYSGLKDLTIPTGQTGIYLDLDTGITGFDDNSPPAGWDINPFFGGTGIANNAVFQPVRLGTANADAVRKLGVGAVVSSASVFSTGFGGSGDPNAHLGSGANQFQENTEGYLGFKFNTNGGAGPYYGWMRLVLTGNLAGALIKDWAYETSGFALATARVIQSAPVSSAQTVTLSPAVGETFTLGSAVTNSGGNINNLIKTGAGTVILASPNTYTGGTSISGGVLNVTADSALGTGGSVTITNDATLQAGGTFTTSRAIILGTGGGRIDTNGQTLTLTAVSGSALTKAGSGTLRLNGTQSFNSLTATGGSTALNTALGTAPGLAAVTVNSGAVVKFGTVSQHLASLTIGAGSTVSFTSGTASFGAEDGGKTGAAGAAVPEPGTLALLLAGACGLLRRARRVA